MTPSHPFPNLSHVTLQQRGELPVLQVNNAHATAAIALQGGQLLEYTPRGSQPVIWLSPQAAWQRGQSVRGGIPVCWPWFGALERNPTAVQQMARGEQLPAHGFVRSVDWTLRSIDERDDATRVTLGLISAADIQQLWPHAAELELRIEIGATLRLQLTTRNLGATPITLTQALHSYFAISAIDQVAVTGFEQSRYIDTLAGWTEQAQQDAIIFTGETDRIYLDVPEQVVLRDRGWRRDIVLRAAESTTAVVWNPWIDKARRLSQFAPAAWREMVCIETANVLDEMVTIAPSATAAIAVEIGARAWATQ